MIPWPELNTVEGIAADDQGHVYVGYTTTLSVRRFVRQ